MTATVTTYKRDVSKYYILLQKRNVLLTAAYYLVTHLQRLNSMVNTVVHRGKCQTVQIIINLQLIITT